MMKRLVTLFGALALALVMAQSTTTFQFAFPKYAAAFTNVDQVEFFTSSYDGSSALGPTMTDYNSGVYFYSADKKYYVADQNGFTKCIDDQLQNLDWANLNPQIQVSGTEGSDTLNISCHFSPNKVSQGDPEVTGYDTPRSDAGGPTDGELIIFTNVSNFNISISTQTQSIPNGITFHAFPGYVKSTNSLAALNSNASWVALNNSSNNIFSQADAYYTNYKRIRVIPLLFSVSVPIENVGYIDPNNPSELKVTWEAAAQ